MSKQVKIMVTGGVVHVIAIPEGVEVRIEDFDNDPQGDVKIWTVEDMEKVAWEKKEGE